MVSSSPPGHPEKTQHLRKKRSPASGSCKSSPPPTLGKSSQGFRACRAVDIRVHLLPPKVQIRFFYLIFSGICCLQMAALGKDGFMNLFLAKPLSSSLMDTHTLRYKLILLQCVVLCMLLIDDSPPPQGAFPPCLLSAILDVILFCLLVRN